MSNILQIIRLSIQELLAKKTLYVLFFIMLLVLGAIGSPLYELISESSNAQTRLAEKANVLAKLTGMWSLFTVYFVIGFSAYSIHSPIKSKSIVGILAKPVSRTEFLLGRWLGVVIFFSTILFFGVVCLLSLLYYWEIPIDVLVLTGVVHQFIMLIVYSVLSFVLSLFLPTLIGGGVAFIIFIFRDILVSLVHSSNIVLQGLGYILFYGAPAPMHDSLIYSGVVKNLLHPDFGMYWRIILENIAYAGLLLFAGILFYQYKDITLD